MDQNYHTAMYGTKQQLTLPFVISGNNLKERDLKTEEEISGERTWVLEIGLRPVLFALLFGVTIHFQHLELE